MGIIDSVGGWLDNFTSNLALSLEEEWTGEVRDEDGRVYNWLLEDHLATMNDDGTVTLMEVNGRPQNQPSPESIINVLVRAYQQNDANFDRLASQARKYQLAPPDFTREKVEQIASVIQQSGGNAAQAPATTTDPTSPEAAQDPTSTTSTVPSSMSTQNTPAYRAGVDVGGSGTPTVTFSEADIRDLMVQSNITDLRQLIQVQEDVISEGSTMNLPDIVMESNQAATPQQAKYMEEYGQRALTRSLTPRQAVRYITDGNVTPGELMNLQNKLIRAGYLDNEQMMMIPGDIMDSTTTTVWSRVLADSVRYNLTIPQLLKKKEMERVQSAVDLNTPQMRDILNNVTLSLIGRPLDSTEMEGLVSYLDNVRTVQGAGMSANDLGQNIETQDVADYLYEEVPTEIGLAGDAKSKRSGSILSGFMP
jgi:hypothetical protein